MNKFVFPCQVSFGKLDCVDFTIEYELSDVDAQRLVASAQVGKRCNLNEDSDIGDIYEKVLNYAVSQDKASLMEDPSPVEAALSWERDDDSPIEVTEEDIDAYLADLDIKVYYPEELQNLFLKVLNDDELNTIFSKYGFSD